MGLTTQSLGFLSATASACPLGYFTSTSKQLPKKLAAPSSSSSLNLGSSTHHVRCSLQKDEEQSRSSFLMDRRDMLVGLGGLYGATGGMPPAHADPLVPPDLEDKTACFRATDAKIEYGCPNTDLLHCCPPYQGMPYLQVKKYDFPKTTKRVRRPAHKVANDPKYMEKYKTAIKMMKDLPENDPFNFYQQAKIHCAYCNDAYDQKDYKGVPLQVHNSWIFFPWHRYYLHFFERILGKLIGDETFALPYWNYDIKQGMYMPSIFLEESSPLFDKNRDVDHYPPCLVDYKYGYKGCNNGRKDCPGDEIVEENLEQLRKVFKDGKNAPLLFMGGKVSAGEVVTTNTMGQMERIHNTFHQWVGPKDSPHVDMGSFATSGRDCLFYCLHANVDRMWELYRKQRGNRIEFDDRDWLDSTFVFYDENRELVKVQTEDSLKIDKFCYEYEDSPTPWLGAVPRKKIKSKSKGSLVQVKEFGSAPRELDEVIQVLLTRPKKSRSKAEKESQSEVLLIKGIQVTDGNEVRFDVYVDAPVGSDGGGTDKGDFVGSLVRLQEPKKPIKGKEKKELLILGLMSTLEENEIEDAEKLVVTLVPRFGNVVIGGLSIEFIQNDVVNSV